ncbi:MAG TPA: helix-turn-helix transcriptional regulator [Ferruginibacter sp.]|nr:helix-turn-helix transcriptional regulator [Ferruginibacter sp.]
MDKEDFNRNLGSFIREKRIKLNMSQSDLASKLENNFQNISRLERGKVSPTLYWIFRLSEAFELEVSQLVIEFDKYIKKINSKE